MNTVRALALFLLATLSFQVLAEEGDIIFVTQPPHPSDFATANAVFGHHRASLDSVPRGGDLYIRYKDGTLKNLTQAAGYGQTGAQGANAIAVRDPVVHWDGAKIIFSMVIGAPTKQYDYKDYRWQMYEMSGLGKTDTPVVTKVANQPSEYNNVNAIYGSDDKIIFTSDRPRDGQPHLYPQRDEYESTPTVSGLWKLDPSSGTLELLDHAPSGDFEPHLDSFGRIIFSRWDHLQRDQQRDAGGYGTFDYSSEGADSVATSDQVEVFPEARSVKDADKKSYEELHTINQFFPWMVNQDGTDLETLNHIGRQEIGGYAGNSRNDDPNLTYSGSGGERTEADILLQIQEDPNAPGSFIGTRCQEFGTHASGQIVKLDGPPTANPDSMRIVYVTHPDTAGFTSTPSANHSGLYRDPFVLKSGQIVAVHTSETREDRNDGTSTQPKSRYAFRLKSLSKNGTYYSAGSALTPGIRKQVSYWSPDALISYDTDLWELQPVEFVARSRPPFTTGPLPSVEQKVFADAGVSLASFKQFMKERDLALIVGRNVTTRDASDRQQPFNLRIPNTSTQTIGAGGTLYDITHLQIFQADLLRGYGGTSSPQAGRRVLARPLHGMAVSNPASGSNLPGTVALGADGSFAAFVPARRAVSWQLISPTGEGIVRERYWLTFQPGEVRVCGSCHGVNTFDQAGHSAPVNAPEALKSLLAVYTNLPPAPDPTVTPSIPGVGQPQFGVAVTTTKGAAKPLVRGGKFLIAVTGKNAEAASKSVTIKITAGKCKQSKTVSTDSSGKIGLTAKLPPQASKSSVKVEIVYNGATVATASAKVKASPAAAAGKKCGAFVR